MGQFGNVVEVLGFDKYKIKMDDMVRISIRNRRHLRPNRPYMRMTIVPGDSAAVLEEMATKAQE